MFKFLKDRKKKDNKGFTLVELVIVIAILAILVGILAPQYTKYVEKSRKSADVNNMDEIIRALEVYYVDQGADSKLAGDTTITITMPKDKTTAVSVKAGDTNLTTDDYIGQYLKNIGKITLKGNWNEDVTATLTVSKDGGVNVTEMKPDTFKTYFERGGAETTN
nr:prepilin-type N-terminal cleavage/methylation domain-containing protein [uncultured Blautia sp.]